MILVSQNAGEQFRCQPQRGLGRVESRKGSCFRTPGPGNGRSALTAGGTDANNPNVVNDPIAEIRVLFAQNGTPRDKELFGILDQLNYTVISVSSLEAAFEACQKRRPDLVLASTDGDVRGLDLCTKLRTDPELRKTSFVVLADSSAGITRFAEHDGGENRADAYLTPSDAPLDVIDRVEQLVGLPLPPKDGAPVANTHSATEMEELQDEIRELEEQILYHRQQADNFGQASAEREALRDEIQLLKGDLAKFEKEVQGKTTLVEEVRSGAERAQAALQRELGELRTAHSAAEDRHKRAQNALREYYKKKMENSPKITSLEEALAEAETRISELESETKQVQMELDRANDRLQKAKKLFS
jgi:CheY-like chemotaxis protein